MRELIRRMNINFNATQLLNINICVTIDVWLGSVCCRRIWTFSGRRRQCWWNGRYVSIFLLMVCNELRMDRLYWDYLGILYELTLGASSLHVCHTTRLHRKNMLDLSKYWTSTIFFVEAQYFDKTFHRSLCSILEI